MAKIVERYVEMFERSKLDTATFVGSEIRQLIGDVSRAEERERVQREALEEALPQIENWSNAYPESIFPAPDWVKVGEMLGDTLLTQVSGANMRHVATRMWAILQPVAALATPAPEQPVAIFESDGPCGTCGLPCECWFTDSPLWNRVNGGASGLLCLRCFVTKAEAMGMNKWAWQLRPECPAPEQPSAEKAGE